MVSKGNAGSTKRGNGSLHERAAPDGDQSQNRGGGPHPMGCFKGCLCLYAFWGQSPFGKESAGGVEERQSLSTGRLISEGRQDSYTMRHGSRGRDFRRDRRGDRARSANGGGRLREGDGYGMK